jgi:Na+/proline symporter
MVVFIVVFCSLASSIDSLLAATSDLMVEDVYKKMWGGSGAERSLRFVAKLVVVALGLVTWLICLGEFNILEVLFLSGPLVASAIWPIITGLYWKSANPAGAVSAMVLGSAAGLIAYYHPSLGWYTASLISVTVSMAVVCVASWLAPRAFDWDQFKTC